MDERIRAALEVAANSPYTSGVHHLRWVIDQMVRHLLGCPVDTIEGVTEKGTAYSISRPRADAAYQEWLERFVDDSDPAFNNWNPGVTP